VHKGRRYRKRITGHPRRFMLRTNISAQLYLGLSRAAQLKHVTDGKIIEEALWAYLSRLTLQGDIIQRIHHAQGLIDQVIAEAHKLPLQAQKGPPNIHTTRERQERRNRISDKTTSAFNQIYELAQSEHLSEQNQMRAEMYAILARLATVNELILRGAAEEEILAELSEMREERNNFDEATRQLETRARTEPAKP